MSFDVISQYSVDPVITAALATVDQRISDAIAAYAAAHPVTNPAVAAGTLATTFSTASTTFVDTGLQASITVAANSKILVNVNFSEVNTTSTTPYFAIQINGVDYPISGSGSNNGIQNFPGSRLSPALAAGTYVVKGRMRVGTGTAACNNSGDANRVSTITALEVKA